jgi:hypothetical protein
VIIEAEQTRQVGHGAIVKTSAGLYVVMRQDGRRTYPHLRLLSAAVLGYNLASLPDFDGGDHRGVQA